MTQLEFRTEMTEPEPLVENGSNVYTFKVNLPFNLPRINFKDHIISRDNDGNSRRCRMQTMQEAHIPYLLNV